MARKRKKNKFAFPIGIIAVILAVIGAVCIVRFAVTSVKKLTDDSSEKQKYEQFLKPVVMFDPDPFDDLTKADVSQLLNCAVWDLLQSSDGTEGYSYAEGEKMGIIVPQSHIEEHFIHLFGTEIDIASLHSSIDMSEYDITYDAALQSYILPVTGIESAYTPVVYSIDKHGSSLILTVGYIGSLAWAQISDGTYIAPEPDKYMNITLRERSGGMYVSSIQAADSQEIIHNSITTARKEDPETITNIFTESSTFAEESAQDMTSIVPVTDEDGEPITDENGEQITQTVTAEQNGESADEENTSIASSDIQDNDT